MITRLAPSPTGDLHLGNAWSFLLCWLAARSQGGKVILRIDDIDSARSKPETINSILEDLAWLGLDWDSFENERVVYQSQRSRLYRKALKKLENRLYPCFCTRRELRALASAPHIGDEGVPYPGTCARLSAKEREDMVKAGKSWALRLACPAGDIEFDDLVQGRQSFAKKEYGGDFALTRSDGVWAYQLASAVDDGEMGVNLILRGRDLLPSAARQILLFDYLGYQVPKFAHIPLLLDNARERLAKRHKSLSLRTLRAKGVAPQAVVGYLGFLAGLNPHKESVAPAQMLPNFSLAAIPKDDVIIDPRDEPLAN